MDDNHSITGSKCNDCLYKLYPLLTGDCPQIKMTLLTISHPKLTIAGYEPNQFCTMSCPGSEEPVEITKCMFCKIPDFYWKKKISN